MPEALFTKVDVDETVTLFEMVDYDPPLKIDDEITLTFRDAGHILACCEPSTLGGIRASGVEEVKIFGKIRTVRANVTVLHSFSAHADYEEICRFLSNIDPLLVEHFFIVRGEPTVQDEFKKKCTKRALERWLFPS